MMSVSVRFGIYQSGEDECELAGKNNGHFRHKIFQGIHLISFSFHSDLFSQCWETKN
jgi:hypothetical protein